MFPEQKQPLTTLTGFAAGERRTARMRNGVRTLRVRLTVEGTVSVTVAGTGIRNRGSILAALGDLGISENGTDRWRGDARALAHAMQFYAAGRPGTTARRRLTAAEATAIGDYDLKETFELVLAPTNIASPTEASFLEANESAPLEVFAEMAQNAAAKIVAGGTVTLSGLTVRATQIFDDKRGLPTDPVAVIPTCRRVAQKAVAAANDSEIIYIQTNRYSRGICISTDSDVGEVGDVINALAVRGDERDVIGPNKSPWADEVADQYFYAGGAVDDTDAHLFLPWVRHGRLSTMHNPAADLNMRIEADVQPSAVAGATNSKITVHIFEMERVEGLVVDPMPFVA